MKIIDTINLELEQEISKICEEYVNRWKTEGKKYINVPDFNAIYAENNITPIEETCLLTVRLRSLHEQNPKIPSSIPELPINLQRKLPIYLTKTLEIQVNPDHYEYWAWSAEIFMNHEISPQILKELHEIREALQLLFHTVLAKLSNPPITRSDIMLNKILDILVSRHVHHMVNTKMLLATPLAFLCFENLVRDLCSDYVDPVTGKAKKDLKLRKLRRKRGAVITLGPLLRLFDELVLPTLPSGLRHDISTLNNVVESIWGHGEDWVNVLINWRNKLLHGIKTWIPRAFGVVTNYICLILWHFIPDDKYTECKERILERIKWQYSYFQDEMTRYYSFYPP